MTAFWLGALCGALFMGSGILALFWWAYVSTTRYHTKG
jgi:hypothetical protein